MGIVKPREMEWNFVENGKVLWRVLGFAALNAALTPLLLKPLTDLFHMARQSDHFSYILLIPVVSLVLIFRWRERIFREVRICAVPGAAVFGCGLLLLAGISAHGERLSPGDTLSATAVSTVVLLIGGFLGFFGRNAFREALFPLSFLFLVTPVPEGMLSEIIRFLQWGSAEAAEGLFKLTGLPVLREGYTFHLPKLSVEVAPQCSGIRSSISLFVVSILVGRFWLRKTGSRMLLILTVVPITLFKNGVRIVTLALLGAYVDQRILSSDLHRSGGIPIFGLALLMLFCVTWILRRMEKKPLPEKG